MALEFGRLDVEPMLLSMSSTQLDEWADYFRAFGFSRDNEQAMLGQLCALTYNINRPKKKRALRAEDFYPAPGRSKPQSEQSMVQKLKSFFGAMAGK